MAQTTLIPYNNKNLFSNYYLDKKVKTSAEWTKNDHIATFSKIKDKYDAEKASFSVYNEAQLIKHFLDPIFEILLYECEVEAAEMGKYPDFAFFKDKNTRDEAHKYKGEYSFYRNALAIGEAKLWDTELDGKPSQQLWNYLDDAGLKWGILTNGRKWRLYCKGNEKKRDEYYEIDLPSLLDSNDIEGFKYFFYFFRRDAFLELPEIFLEGVLRESEVHAKTIGNNLKENVYKAMKKIAEGFFGRPQNNLDRNDKAARERVQKNTMLLLYRLLFLLYAEDRNLLDLTNPKYLNNHSFRRIKKEVEEKRGRIEQGYDYSGTTIWDRLKSLFELINVGSEAIGEKEFHVPAYNGGLFDTKKNPELDEKWKIGDKYLAEAIHLLTWSEINGAGFVDYSELEIRHLGSIYEGLLEYKLKVAEADIVTKENEWVSLEKYNEGRKQKKTFEQFDEFSRARKGELYLATDKGERKATGSYYTPDYIVNYIVRNTLEPVVEERWKEDEAKNQSFMEATLSVKVLDPAMGSGHFLVGAVDFLAEKLLNAAQKDIEAGRLREDERFSDLDWARREVVAHCIYGVDLNPMAVELAKVSLWLKTISREKPLSFLDHRLKQGNSLIGAQLEDLPYYPDVKRKKKEKKVKDAAQQTFEVEIERPFFDKIVKILNSLTDINDDSIENINKKKDIFEKLIASPEYQRIKALANLHTAVYFGVETTKVDRQPKDGYNDILWALRDNEEEWRKKTNREWFGKARRLAEEKSFFHWELEFPELFFEGGAPKEAPGWDAVVGNPPYDVLSAKERGEEEEKLQYELDYFKGQISGFSGKLNLYRLMSERSYSYIRDSGRFGFIIPNTVMADQSSAPLRKFLFENSKEISFLEFPEKARVFTDVTQAVCIVVAQKGTPKAEEIFLASGLKTGSDLLAPKFFNLKLKEILEIDGEYYLPYVSEKSIDLFRKLLNFPRTGNLNDLSIFQGEVNLTNYKECIKTNDGAQLIRGDHLSRYELIFNTEKPSYLDVQCYLTKAGDAEKAKHHKSQRVAFQEVANMQLSRRLNATLIEQNQFLGHTTNYFIVKNNYSIYFILALFNSQLLNWRFKLTSTTNHVSGDEVRRLPIRRISFTTPPDRRAALVDEAKALYSEFCSGMANSDRINRMDRINSTTNPVNPVHPVQTGASFSAVPNSQKILEFVSVRLLAVPEESDVVHDLLAHLAERMIEMNKEKNAEIKGFLRWLEGEIGAPVEELANKTALKVYYAHDFEAFANALAKNKKKLKEGYDPTRREPKDKLRDEFNASMGKLAPLLKRIEATDMLIDQIVYRLYGLTEDEIKIVKESISGKTSNTIKYN